jgi:hypothetical protein
MDELAQLVESTWRIRHHPAWADARRALRETGVDPDRAICTYFGGCGDNGCEFALPDGRLLFVSILIGWDGCCFVPTERVKEEYALDPSQKLALSIAASADSKSFDAAVLKRFQEAEA